MASLVGIDVPEFGERYWGHRVPYDRGGDARTFWSAVIGEPVDDHRLKRLIRLDIDSWSHLNGDSLTVLMDARERGYSLSLLSNAPEELAVAVSDRPEFADFDHLLFSARIGAVKPEAGAFDAAVHELGHPREQILFVDDRRANVEGAIDSGLRAVLFTSAAALAAELAPA